MWIFDRIDPLHVDRRQWELWMLALTVIFVLAVGISLLMYPAVFSNDLNVSGTAKRKLFIGFCGLSVLLIGYLLDRQVVINQLNKRLREEIKRAEEDLRASEAKFRALSESAPAAIFENAAIGIALVDVHGHPLRSNAALQKMLGYTKFELAHMAFTEYTHTDDAKADWDLFTELVEGKRDQYQVEKRFFRKNGQVVWGRLNVSLVRNEKGEFKYSIGMVEDISERKRAEGALRNSEERFRLFMNNSPAVAWMKDEQGRYVYLSGSYLQRHRVRLEDQQGKTDFEVCPRAFAEQFRKNDQAALAAGHAIEVTEESLGPDGKQRWWLVYKFPFQDTSGQVLVAGIGVDITERRRAEEALRESEERFRGLVENATFGIYRTAPDGHILMANPGLVRMLGFESFEELAARNLECDGFEPGHPGSVFRERIEREGQVVGLEAAWIRRDGSVVFVRQRARAVRAEDGRVLYYDGIAEDITTERESQEAMRQLPGRLLRLQDEERRRLARELHENTAQGLAALANNLTMLKTSAADLSPRAGAFLSESLDLAEQCSKEIRTLSYLLHPPLVDEAGLAPALRWFTAGFAQRSGIEAHVGVSPEFGRLPVELELTLYRIVQEALTNIHRHSGSKTARICLQRLPKEIVLTVADEGHGFPSVALGNAGPESADVGVGIPGMRERLRQLGGRLHIQSGSQGTTLTAILPFS